MKNHDTLTKYVASFVQQLYLSGMEEVVISPGSRSTPLAILFCDHPKIKTFVHVDERSAAFFALGRAKATNRPVGIVCTSGSAAANYYPAIVEAKQSRVPLVVLTSDRPHELRDVGAPQAMNQNQMYASYTKWFHDAALPEQTENMLKYIGKMAMRAVTVANASPKGVVHINLPFREPLMPNLQLPNLWKAVQTPVKSVISARKTFESSQLQALHTRMKNYPNGIIVCGPEMERDFTHAVIQLSESYQVPVFVDPLSQMRGVSHANFIHSYDTLLRSMELREKMRPDWMLRFGAQPVSKALSQFMMQAEFLAVIDADEGWRDPAHDVDQFYFGDENHFCTVMAGLADANETRAVNQKLAVWQQLHQKVKEIFKQRTALFSEIEGAVISDILTQMPKDSALMVANSMPIRELDSFDIFGESGYKVYANRGVNGIDGLVSTALGLSVTHGKLTLLIGDLAFYHDCSALILLKKLSSQVKVVLINNHGGGIFSFLPQAKDQTYFETIFGTPLDLDFGKLAAVYDLSYEHIQLADASQGITSLYQKEGSAILEVSSNREKNEQAHRKLWAAVNQEIEQLICQLEV